MEPNHAQHIHFTVDELPLNSDAPALSAEAIIAKSGKDPTTRYLVQLGAPGADAISFAERPTSPITLENGMRFETVRCANVPVTIIVNTRKRQWLEPAITFEQLVHLAFPDVAPDAVQLYTVTYQNGPNGKEDTLKPGQTVEVHQGMIFDVSPTNKS